MKTRNELHKLARVTKLPADWENFYLARNEVKNILRNAEKALVQGESSNNNNNNKNSLWKVIRKCLPRTEVSQPVYSKDVKTLANELNASVSIGSSVSEASKSLAAEHDLLYCPHPLHGKVLSLRRVMSSIFIRFHAEKYVKWCNLFHLIRHLDMTKSLWPLSRTPCHASCPH